MHGRSRIKRLLGLLLLTLALRPCCDVSASTTRQFTFFQTLMLYSQTSPVIAVLPRAPITTSPVPGLTSLYHKAKRGNYGDARYPGNCSGELIKDLLCYFDAKRVLDPLTGSGTCTEVCRELDVECRSTDLRSDDTDACDPKCYENIGTFDFVWLHPPYWRQKVYSRDQRDLSNAPTLSYFLFRYQKLIANCSTILHAKGKIAILMGDYSDREAGFVPLTYHTKRIAFSCGLRQACTDIIRFSHGASSSKKVYRSSFIPGLHDVCMVFTKPELAITGARRTSLPYSQDAHRFCFRF